MFILGCLNFRQHTCNVRCLYINSKYYLNINIIILAAADKGIKNIPDTDIFVNNNTL